MANDEKIIPARQELIKALLVNETSCTRIDSQQARTFTKDVLTTLNVCTNSNIETCRDFILRHVVTSSRRTAALMKYLLITSRSFSPSLSGSGNDSLNEEDHRIGLGRLSRGRSEQLPSTTEKRFNVLKVLGAVLLSIDYTWRRFTQNHDRHDKGYDITIDIDPILVHKQITPHIPALVSLASFVADSATTEQPTYLSRDVQAWIDSWIPLSNESTLRVFSNEDLARMRMAALQGHLTSSSEDLQAVLFPRTTKNFESEHPFQFLSSSLTPRQLSAPTGPSANPVDLPATNGLYMKRMYGYPLNFRAMPPGGFALAHAGQPVPEDLQTTVTNLHRDMAHCFDRFTDPDAVQDIDALGNKIWKDPERPTRNYWGWSYDGVARRKTLALKFVEDTAVHGYRFAPMSQDSPAWFPNRAPSAPSVHPWSGHGHGPGQRGGRGRGRGGPGFGDNAVDSAVDRARALTVNPATHDGGRGGMTSSGGWRGGGGYRNPGYGDGGRNDRGGRPWR